MSETALAVVCVSGGMDSAVTAALAAREHRLAFLHANYGQRTEAKELACFHGARRPLRRRGPAGRRLLRPAADRRQQPDGRQCCRCARASRSRASSRPPTSPSATRTCSPRRPRGPRCWRARALFVGAVWEDSSGYPDCRPEFYRAFEAAIRLGTRPETELRIVTPVIQMSKAEIVRVGLRAARAVREDLVLLPGGRSGPAAAASPAGLRIKGFREAGVADPIPYETAW